MDDPSRRTLPGPPVADDLVPTRSTADTPTVVSPNTPDQQPTLVPGSHGSATSPVELPPPGYLIGEVIGQGGMGEVLAAVDMRMGREVAIKRMRGEAPSREATARFLREAMVQARLDHPAIAPVHELGADDTGQPYFTMKRLTGVTLGAKLAEGRASLQLLLRAFVDVCRAVSFAHARGVVHGDLKPANIMLGEYGEVYVIDWGIARVLDTATPGGSIGVPEDGSSDRPAPGPLPERVYGGRRFAPPVALAEEGAGPSTPLGTPGYMAPEQLRDGTSIPASDVYALGATLFELLAGEPLHPRGTLAIVSTLAIPDGSPGERRPDRNIAVELDALTRAALVEDPAARPSARKLADEIQRFLDGDRDLERRRALAAQLVTEAEATLAGTAADRRVVAIRLAGRALALDPESPAAAQLVGGLLLEPPAELPPDLIASLEAEERGVARDRSRIAMAAFLSIFAFWAIIPFLTVRSWPNLIALYAIIGLACAVSFASYRTGRVPIAVLLGANLLVALAFSRIASVFVLTPVVISVALMALTSIPWFGERRLAVIAWAAAALLIPLVLEGLGVLAPTSAISDDGLTTMSSIFGGPAAIGALVPANLAFIIVGGVLAAGLHRRRREAQRRLHIQAWHLGQLLPKPISARPSSR